MRSLVGLVLAAMLWPLAAQASGGVSCRVSAPQVRFTVGATISRGSGAFFQGGARLDLTAAATPPDFKRTQFALVDLVHRWLDDGSLKLAFYRERTGSKPHGYVSLKIDARADPNDEGTYRGRYLVTLYDVDRGQKPLTLKHEGDVTCSVE